MLLPFCVAMALKFCALCTTMLKCLRRSRKFCVDLECSNTGLTPAKAQSTPSFGTERLIILQTILFIFSDLCGPFDVAQDMLGVFAGDIPSFGCGSGRARFFAVKFPSKSPPSRGREERGRLLCAA